MTLGRKILNRVNSPKSPKLANSSLRRRTLLKRLSSSGVQFGTASKANLKVVVRVRPENQRERENNARSVVDIVDEHMMIFDPQYEEDNFFFQGAKQKFRDLNKRHHKEQKFIFERIFNPTSTNEEIFQTTTKDIVETLLNGYNCSVFAYGATGSGKTYTMIGTGATPGITFLTVMELYRRIEEIKEEKMCEVGVSYLEVYNEMVRDLLSPGKPLNLHETGHHVQVTGLSLHKPKDANDLLRILAEGNQNRSQHPTDANAESSRSHAVFQVFLRQQEKCADIKSGVSIAKLSMIDLAGSERGSATGFTGARFREGANINKSLLALGNCINALADGKGHIPYRDSKLTRLLKDSIGGNCRSVMIATITKSSLSFEDTYNTLRYANRAKTIKTTLKKNIMNVDQHVAQYLKVVEGLKEEISGLKAKLKEYEEMDALSSCKPSEEIVDGERQKYEEIILDLQEQLEEKENKSLGEKEFLKNLTELNLQFRSYQREILQLETAERELKRKIYVQRLHVVRMSIFSFASIKLDKGISKSNRSIQSYEKHLHHIFKKKNDVQGKMSAIKESIAAYCREFKTTNELNSSPELLTSNLRNNDLEQSVRDSYQINEYLQCLVKNVIGEQDKSEKLIALLLVALKHFYLKLKSLEKCDDSTNDFLEKIYGMLDESRIEWADLKNTDESFGEQIISEHVQLAQAINPNELVKFPVTQSIDISPILVDPSKMYRRSNLKKSSRSNNLLIPTSKDTKDLCSPISSKRCLKLEAGENECGKEERKCSSSVEEISDIDDLSSNITKEIDYRKLEQTPPSPVLNGPFGPCKSAELKFSLNDDEVKEAPKTECKESIKEETINSSNLVTDSIYNVLESSHMLYTKTLFNDKDVSSCHNNVDTNISHEELIPHRENYTGQDVLPVKNNFDVQNSTFTCSSSEAQGSSCSENVLNIPALCLPDDKMESSKIIEASNSCALGANETFNISNETQNEAKNLDATRVLQNIPSSTFKNKDNILPKGGVKKLGSGLTPSRFSSSRLPPHSATKALNKGLKTKSISVSSFHTATGRTSFLYNGNQGKDTMKRSVSGFLKPKVSSVSKNQENAPPRTTVAFGSSMSKSPRTKKSLFN